MIYGGTKLTIRQWFVAPTILLDLCRTYNTLHNECTTKFNGAECDPFLFDQSRLTLLDHFFTLFFFLFLFLHFLLLFLWFLLTLLVNHDASSLLGTFAVRERKWKVRVHSGEFSGSFYFLLLSFFSALLVKSLIHWLINVDSISQSYAYPSHLVYF